MLGYICNNTKISGRNVGKIDVKGVYSFFEVQNEDVDKVMTSFKGIDFKGREVRIEISGEGTSSSRPEGGRREGGYSSRPGGDRREGGYSRNGGGERRSPDGNRDNRERSTAGSAGGGFRDFSGKRKEDRPERRRRF
jgi:ATP-dependent RNA helicase DeaD